MRDTGLRRLCAAFGLNQIDDDFEIVQVYDHSATITERGCPDGSDPRLADLPFSEQEFCPPDAFAELEPDEQLFHEATGNEGASFERSYRQAVFVLWPQARRLTVLSQGGITATLPWLVELVPAASRLIAALPADQIPTESSDQHRGNPIDTDLAILPHICRVPWVYEPFS